MAKCCMPCCFKKKYKSLVHKFRPKTMKNFAFNSMKDTGDQGDDDDEWIEEDVEDSESFD